MSASMPVEGGLALPLKAETWLHERYGVADLRPLLKAIAAAKRTGSVTLHFSQGAISSIEWKQRAPKMSGDT